MTTHCTQLQQQQQAQEQLEEYNVERNFYSRWNPRQQHKSQRKHKYKNKWQSQQIRKKIHLKKKKHFLMPSARHQTYPACIKYKHRYKRSSLSKNSRQLIDNYCAEGISDEYAIGNLHTAHELNAKREGRTRCKFREERQKPRGRRLRLQLQRIRRGDAQALLQAPAQKEVEYDFFMALDPNARCPFAAGDDSYERMLWEWRMRRHASTGIKVSYFHNLFDLRYQLRLLSDRNLISHLRQTWADTARPRRTLRLSRSQRRETAPGESRGESFDACASEVHVCAIRVSFLLSDYVGAGARNHEHGDDHPVRVRVLGRRRRMHWGQSESESESENEEMLIQLQTMRIVITDTFHWSPSSADPHWVCQWRSGPITCPGSPTTPGPFSSSSFYKRTMKATSFHDRLHTQEQQQRRYESGSDSDSESKHGEKDGGCAEWEYSMNLAYECLNELFVEYLLDAVSVMQLHPEEEHTDRYRDTDRDTDTDRDVHSNDDAEEDETEAAKNVNAEDAEELEQKHDSSSFASASSVCVLTMQHFLTRMHFALPFACDFVGDDDHSLNNMSTRSRSRTEYFALNQILLEYVPNADVLETILYVYLGYQTLFTVTFTADPSWVSPNFFYRICGQEQMRKMYDALSQRLCTIAESVPHFHQYVSMGSWRSRQPRRRTRMALLSALRGYRCFSDR